MNDVHFHNALSALCWLNIHVWNMLVLRGGARGICLCLVFKVETFGTMLAVLRAFLLHLSMRRDGACASCQRTALCLQWHDLGNGTQVNANVSENSWYYLTRVSCSPGLWRKCILKSKVRRGTPLLPFWTWESFPVGSFSLFLSCYTISFRYLREKWALLRWHRKAQGLWRVVSLWREIAKPH